MLELTALLNEEAIKYSVALSLISGIGRAKLARLRNYFSSLEVAWKASPDTLAEAGLV